ncbi:transcriptional regulator [Streptomyces aidingensis]|uniref:transcriptional regulator n=1 Tax=Streptomyces aidingensis TaxID=910347 RepID=UPI0031845EC9
MATTTSPDEEDPMRRRALLLRAAGLSVTTPVLHRVDEALAVLPGPPAAPTTANLLAHFRRARTLFDAGGHSRFFAELPGLLALAHAQAENAGREAESYVRLAACYDLATEALSKVGHYSAARITADRSNTFSELSGSPLAAASSARAFSIVLRHEGRGATARQVTLNAAARVEATGLPGPSEAAVYAQMLCTCAYTAAQADDRDRALEMINDAERVVARLGPPADRQPAFTVTAATVALYKVGVLWSLGDAGTAVHTGSAIDPRQLPTAERRGRLHTDMARAWWQWGRPEQTAHALLAAHREAPAEVRDRPTIRGIVSALAARHPRTDGVRELVAAVRGVPQRP